MPIQDRRYFIQKHNAEQEEMNRREDEARNANFKGYKNNGDLNSYARLEQQNNANRKRG